MKKIAYIIVAICMAMTGVTSCVDLDTAPYAEATGGNMWSTESLVEMGVIGVYNSLKKPLYSGSMVGESLWVGYYGWDVFGMSGSSRLAMNNVFTSSVNPGNGYFSNTWKWCYDGVHRANGAIAAIPNSDMEASKRARRLAEVKVLRAFFYGRLNELFGNGGLGVPLYLEPVSADECNRTQTPEAEVWVQIIRDLTEAIEEPALPNNDINGEGRVSKGCAYALRGRAYLITKEYDKAAADFDKVGQCGYGLYTGAGAQSYKQLFKEANERCEEMILSIQYIADASGGNGGYGSTLQKYVAAFQQGSKDGRGCWSDIRIAPAVVELYEVTDGATVSDFDYETFFPGWNSLSVNDRRVFFLRDKKKNGVEIQSGTTSNTISGAIDNIIKNLSEDAKKLYLPEGNEARVRAAYANRDPRLAFNVVTPYAEFIGVNNNSTAAATYVYRWPMVGKPYANDVGAKPELDAGITPSGCANASDQLVYMHRKFVGEGLEFDYRVNNPIDEPLLRYADVLLLWAEALIEKGDAASLALAKAKIKLVRDRAGIATPDAPFTAQATARNYLRNERRREFVGEGVNFFDEMRWRTLKETKFDRKTVEQVYGGTVGTGGTYSWIGDQWYTWPVPKDETERNPNITPTPGWIYQ